ncbi:hypothetical protein D3C79_687620 [compost metagenome]
MLVAFRQGARQGNGADRHQPRSEQVDAAPATQFGHETGGCAGQQDTQQQPAHQCPDHPPALAWITQARGHRHQYLGHYREQSSQCGTQQQPDQAWRKGTYQQAQGADADHADDQPALFEQVAQRCQQQQPSAIAQLRGNDDGPGAGGGQAEMLGDAVQQRLRVVVAGDGKASGGGHQQDQAAAQWGSRGGHGPSRSVAVKV